MGFNANSVATIYSLLVFATSSVVAAEPKQAGQSKPPLSEFKKALDLTPNINSGRKLYVRCVACHGPEGWGDDNGSYPQIAGQLPGVTIKQLADIRAGNRDNPIMRAFTSGRALGGAQEIADVAGYISTLPMTAYNGQGSRHYLDLGREIYQRDCADCHGDNGEGDASQFAPRIQGQHINYLVRQFEWIRIGKRRNADSKMVKQIRRFTPRQEAAVLDYVAHLRPPAEDLAEPGWTNPDFPNYARVPMPAAPDVRFQTSSPPVFRPLPDAQ